MWLQPSTLMNDSSSSDRVSVSNMLFKSKFEQCSNPGVHVHVCVTQVQKLLSNPGLNVEFKPRLQLGVLVVVVKQRSSTTHAAATTTTTTTSNSRVRICLNNSYYWHDIHFCSIL